jgi:TusA-related sulfurtransferase
MSLQDAKVDKSVDICGKICPYTVMDARDALKPMANGEVLEVIIDYEPAVKESIPNFCKKKGYPYEVVDIGSGKWKILIKKQEG